MLVIESCNIFSPYWQILENFFKTQVVTKRFWKNFQAFPNILISGYQRGEFLEFFSNSISWLLAKEKKNLEIGNTQEKCFSKIVWKIFRKSFWLMTRIFRKFLGKPTDPCPESLPIRVDLSYISSPISINYTMGNVSLKKFQFDCLKTFSTQLLCFLLQSERSCFWIFPTFGMFPKSLMFQLNLYLAPLPL